MSRADAIRDGVEIVEDGRWGCYYKIPCAQCGNTYGSRQYTGNRIYLCPTCREINKKKRKAAVDELALSIPDVETKEEKRYRKAVEEIEKQVGSLKGYERAVEICRKATSYHVDFALPDEKLIIEVDGSIYHANTQKELEREAAINYRIGFDWHFIHIPAESISKDVRKVVRLLKKRDTGDKYSF